MGSPGQDPSDMDEDKKLCALNDNKIGNKFDESQNLNEQLKETDLSANY